MQGDQYKIPIELKYPDGDIITQAELKELEIFVGIFRKTLSDNTVVYEEEAKAFNVFLTQKETFMLSGDVKIQARLLFLSGDVNGINLGTINFEESTSKVVLK
jgi:hypothetical protein